MKKLGLDIGSSSLGWALREDNRIQKKGVVTFESGMIKGQGGYTSPTKDRRDARSKRRLIQARKYRKWELLKVLLNEFVPLDKSELETWCKYKKGRIRKFPENEKFLKWLVCDFTYQGGIKYKNPYELRVKAVEEKLSKHEFGRALYHIIQRRGYKNIGESDYEEFDIEEAKRQDSETKAQLERRDKDGFKDALDKHGAISKALKNEFIDKGLRARNQYPLRKEYKTEFEKICQAQGYDISRNSETYKNPFVQSLWKAIIWQRPLRSQKGNIGKCTLEPTKPRCPVSHPVFEVFRSLSFINTIKFSNSADEPKQPISSTFKKALFEEVFLKKDKNFKFEEIRKFLDKQFKEKKQYNYPLNRKGIYDSSVSGMPVCKGLINVFGDEIKETLASIESYHIGNAPKIIYGKYSIYDLWHILYDFDEAYLKKYAVENLKVENERNKKGKEFNPFVRLKQTIQTSYADLSLKAMCKIIPFLKEGYLYNEAVVLAKLPELLGERWKREKEGIKESIQKAKDSYSFHKTIIGITNSLIDKWKADVEAWRDHGTPVKAWKDFTYTLNDQDLIDVENDCIGFFGEKTWEGKNDKKQILDGVAEQYQAFFKDHRRAYREVPTLSGLFKEYLRSKDIDIPGKLYHHSKSENRYGDPGVDKSTGLEILPEPRIDSIKNPMFNKSMSLLRKVVNELIKDGEIDEETEVVIEVARELNDNNKRAAIERYQREREQNRKKYREFLTEFKEQESKSFNVDESIGLFELWTEQTFENTANEKGQSVKNTNHIEILREKAAVKRYELWMEQKGQCMYTGKMISISQLFSDQIDLEHTIPRWLLPDNTRANQTVAFAHYNRDDKGKELPYFLPNFNEDVEDKGTAIMPRLENWIEERDRYKYLYESRLKPSRNEDEKEKNKRIQDKHYFKMHLDYWANKVARFTAVEVKESWARRQLVDTQLVSKYAREFLQSYFKKVAVQKGQVTSNFRKIYGFQEEDEIKSRNRHTHHAIDAAVLTLIPVNSSQRERMIKEYYSELEKSKHPKQRKPFVGFNPQALIADIESSTLIVNYEKDKLLKRTFKNVRQRGRLQYLIKDGKEIPLKAKGDTVRSDLFAQTYLAKIHNVKRDSVGKPQRNNNGKWEFESGDNEFLFVKRIPVDQAKTNLSGGKKPLGFIIDPEIREIVEKARKSKIVPLDPQGNPIRHVRTISKRGRKVKNRHNYLSKHKYKNAFYSEAGEIPYAILIEKGTTKVMIPIASFEVAKAAKRWGGFNIEKYINEFHPQFSSYSGMRLLKVGQKVIVFNSDDEYAKITDTNFQLNRMYVITQFSQGSIWLKYHLEAQSKDEIKKSVRLLKDQMLRNHEISLGIPEVVENLEISDVRERTTDYENRKYRFDTINNSFRLQNLTAKLGLDRTKEIKAEIDKLKAIAGTIEIDGKTPLLKMSSKNWNFLYEGEDFKLSLLGQLTIIDTEHQLA